MEYKDFESEVFRLIRCAYGIDRIDVLSDPKRIKIYFKNGFQYDGDRRKLYESYAAGDSAVLAFKRIMSYMDRVWLELLK